MSYKGSGNSWKAGQRYAGKMAQQDRRQAATEAEITAAEDALTAARTTLYAVYAAQDDAAEAQAAERAAATALEAIDPQSWMFS